MRDLDRELADIVHKAHTAVSETLSRHGISDARRGAGALGNELLVVMDDCLFEVWEGADGRLDVRPVDAVGANSQEGAADRAALMKLRDQTKRLRLGLARLSPFRWSLVVKELGEGNSDSQGALADLEKALNAVIGAMGPPREGRGRRADKDSRAAQRMRGVLHRNGVTDDWKCAGVIADILSARGRGQYSQDAIYKKFKREPKR